MTKKADKKVKAVATVEATAIAIIQMIRPEDRSPEPVIADVPEPEIAYWKSEGWTVKA
jgi:hypothetical protein